MPRILDAATRSKILKLAQSGRRIGEIATVVGCDRHTVSRYLKNHDDIHEISASTALAVADLARLQALARAVRNLTCGGCARPFVALTSMADGVCPHCGATWQVRARQP
jgi:transposase-like protein